MKIRFLFLVFILSCSELLAQRGYELWLGYAPVEDMELCNQYRKINESVYFLASSEQLQAAKAELSTGLKKLIDTDIQETTDVASATLIIGTPVSCPSIKETSFLDEILQLDEEGFLIRTYKINNRPITIIAANSDVGILYGVFHYLRLMQANRDITQLDIIEEPALQIRILNHWDNLNGTIERGYAGYTLWDWQRLPGYRDPRYTDYARANASIGINSVVLNNVNANARSLQTDYIIKAAALADAFRPYGIRVFLTARFSAPKEIGGLNTADPLEPEVKQWWKDKVGEIYEYIPDFGGFLVKANSEGQPGPHDYGRSHADGANMMAEALEPYNGVVMWRAFVYHNERHIDRAINAYDEFKPLDGKFRKNVFVQPKNGPIDFQPREPFHPLFGAMLETPLIPEFQITQEYLGYASHLAYLGALFEETLQSDTYCSGEGLTVAKVIRNYKDSHGISGMAGVANIGSDLNWTGHLFGQANWYAFGRMAWNPDVRAGEIAEEWIRMTFSNDEDVIQSILQIMMMSREAVVNYMNPLGLNHIMNFATHYGPGPWYKDPDWDARDYHKADNIGLGVDRTESGSNAVSQYYSPLREQFNNIETCPQEYLLWFHHVPWEYRMKSGLTMWEELVKHYHTGVEEVRQMQDIWDSLEERIDNDAFVHVKQLLKVQEEEAIWWRDGCLLYFQSYSEIPIPEEYEQPRHSLEYYKKIPFPYNWKESQYR